MLAKKLTGEPEITAKFMRQDYFTFPNQMAVWLATNYKPVVHGADLAIWRRIRLIPFEVTIPRGGPHRPGRGSERLRAEATGPRVDGRGLAPLPRGRPAPRARGGGAATQGYREEMDPLAGWLQERVDEDPDGAVPIDWVKRSYRAWTEMPAGTPLATGGSTS